MKILGIDTSTSTTSLAVSDDGSVIAEYNKQLPRQTSRILIPSMRDALKKANCALETIDAFAVGLGPGSFTGLRIGVSAVKGLSFATEKPIIGISSLDIIAQNMVSTDCFVCPVLDARRNMVYASIYKLANGIQKRISDYMLIDIATLMKKIKQSTIFLGDGAVLYRNDIVRKKGKKARFADDVAWYPRASNLVLMAEKRYNKLKRSDPKKIVPLYLFPKECQISKKKKK
ncbi:tRNA (adenosine(37)-N6)-threonylcarbamoyltransferase complex dimerization subunit type 1 TsaB [Candidatus Omnitrophota bacterium]